MNWSNVAFAAPASPLIASQKTGEGKEGSGPSRGMIELSGGMLDAYKRVRDPSERELLAELKNTVWTCSSLNAAVCADYPPRLYVRTRVQDRKCIFQTKALKADHPLALSHKGMATVEEVVEHPLLTLLQSVNPTHNQRDLWELVTLYQECHGSAYWLLEMHPVLGIPSAIWPLPSHCVRPYRAPNSTNVVDYYEFWNGREVQRLNPDLILHFKYPNPRDPYGVGLSPLKAIFEDAALASIFRAYKRSVWDNAAQPGVVISAEEQLSPDERDRIERDWNQRFRRGGNGRVLVSELGLKVDVIQNSLADVAALAEAGFTKEQIANAFGVPLAFLTTHTNLANLQAAEDQHARKAIRPRLQRRDEKLNERLIPFYDDSGRLFLWSDDPIPENQDIRLRQERMWLETGKRTINELRADEGLPPVPWGNKPFVTPRVQLIQSDDLDQANKEAG